MDIVVFTDGSAKRDNKSNTVYSGYSNYYPNNEFEDVGDPFLIKPYTNQRAELYAIYIAIKTITSAIPDFGSITVYTDSEYSRKCATEWVYKWVNNNWKTTKNKPVKNRDILEEMYHLLKKFRSRIYFVHVRSHSKGTDELSINNTYADKLASAGSDRAKKIITHIKKLMKKF